MKENELFDEELIIRTDDLIDIATPDRAQRALDILEERNATFDVIIVMRAEESRVMLEQLQKRGLRVPQDVALTSYEVDISIEFSDPPITTIYFPFRDIGYLGCVKMVELLTHGEIPYTTLVPSHILILFRIRNRSRGCRETRRINISIREWMLANSRLSLLQTHVG